MRQRANERWQTMLQAYEALPIDPGVAEALLEYMAVKKSERPDM